MNKRLNGKTRLNGLSMTFIRRSLLQLTILLATGVPLAGGAKDKPVSQSNRSLEQEAGVKITKDARGRKVQYVDFGETMIEGKAKTPDGFVIQSRTLGKFNSLIELRKDFRDKIGIHALETVTLTMPAE